MKLKHALLLIILLNCMQLHAGDVDSIEVFSKSMNKSFKCIVITPDSYQQKNTTTYPVVYLLHGYSGWYSNWILRAPELKDYADQFQILIVCPEGGYSSWYFDSPIDSSMRYETYVGKEVVQYIDKHYRTAKQRNMRAITGLSMGGHGALYIAWRNADVFGAAGSMSGGVDLEPLKKRTEIAKILGDTLTEAENWKNNSVINMIEKAATDSLQIMVDCGTDDYFFQINQNLHQKMLKLRIPHDYVERPGKHDWNYWRNAIVYQLTFFSKYFKAQKTSS